MGINKGTGGRPRDTFADPHLFPAKDEEGNVIAKECRFCGHRFSIRTSITRIKAHLGGVPGQGVAPCKQVLSNVEEGARNAMARSNSNMRLNAYIPDNNDMQQHPIQESCSLGSPPQTVLLVQEQHHKLLDGSAQQCNIGSTCLDVQLNLPEMEAVIPNDLESQVDMLDFLQDGMQQTPSQVFYASGPPPSQNMLPDSSPQQTNVDSTCWDGQFNLFEGLNYGENYPSYYAGFLSQIGLVETQQHLMIDETKLLRDTLTSQEVLGVPLYATQPNESCSTNGTLASKHPTRQYPGGDPNWLPYQDVLQDAARMGSTHDVTIPQNFLRGVCSNGLPDFTHQEDMPAAGFDHHEGLKSQDHIQENLQRDKRISSPDLDHFPSIVPQLHHMHIDSLLESLGTLRSTLDQAKHEKKRKFLDPKPIGKKLPVGTIFQGPTFNEKEDEIIRSLVDDSVSRVGVYGMGGSGKTTIMKHIHNLLLEGCFMPCSHVIWVTVSQNHTVSRLQRHLASKLKVELPCDEDEVAWAALLYEEMQKLHYALILDDLWDKVDLEQVGIPEPSRDNGCKVILTTRSLDVCRRMRCKPIFLGLLSEEEAWELFVKTLNVDPKSSTIQDIIKEVTKECAGLPLAIVTIAGSMSGILDVHEWRNALDSLRNCTNGFTNMKDQVMDKLKFSYYRLSEQLQKCLLLCALYPEDSPIRRDDLIELMISEGIIGIKESLKSAYDHGKTILNKLKNSCLLLISDCSSYWFDVHDLIRDMCLDIMGDRFLVKCRSKSPPDLSEYGEVLEKVSLINSEFEEIPSHMAPYCPKLSMLLLSQNKNLKRISDSFFMGLPGLQVLNLSGTSIQELPSSITSLVSLNALVLQRCFKLRYLPCLTPLKALKKLDLLCSGIKEAPVGLEKLVDLTHLDLDETAIKAPPGLILGNLVKLKHLVLPDDTKIMMNGVKELKNLEVFKAVFANWEDFNEYVSSMLNSGREFFRFDIQAELTYASSMSMSYKIRKGEIGGRIEALLRLSGDHSTRGFSWLSHEDIAQIPSPEIVEALCIQEEKNNCYDLSILEEEASPSLHMSPTHLHQDISELKGTFDAVLLLAFPNLVHLEVRKFKFTEELISTSSLVGASSSSVVSLNINDCNKLVRMVDSKVLPCFQNLQEIEIVDCECLNSIVSGADPIEKEERNGQICFPKLRELFLWNLPNLRSICDGTLICPSIKYIEVRRCPKLKRLPLQLPVIDDDSGQLTPPLSSLKKIRGKSEWWESLEWDHPHAKTLLQPYFEPI